MIRGYDTPQLYREETLKRIRQMEREINRHVREMNEIIKKGRLPEKPIPMPFPGVDNDPE
jgi:CHASE3 domain sensor protein